MQTRKLLSAAALALLALGACKKQDKPASGSAGASPASEAAAPVDGPLVITGELEEIAGQFPANDIYNYAYVMKYKIVKVHKGEWADADILVAHYNPRVARSEVKDDQDPKVGGDVKGFRAGDKHHLVLTDLDGTWTGAIEDEYYKDRRRRHWALWADKR